MDLENYTGEPVDGKLMTIVAIIGIVVNLAYVRGRGVQAARHGRPLGGTRLPWRGPLCGPLRDPIGWAGPGTRSPGRDWALGHSRCPHDC